MFPERGDMVRRILRENKMRQGANFHLYQKLGGWRKESEYVGRNVSDMLIHLKSSQAENAIKRNGVGKLLEVLSGKFGKMLTKSQLVDRRTDLLKTKTKEIIKVITMKTQENSDNNAQKQTMGAVVSHVSIGPDPSNLRSKLKINR